MIIHSSVRHVVGVQEVWLDQEDVQLLKEGEEVTLMDWGNAVVQAISRSEDGKTITGRNVLFKHTGQKRARKKPVLKSFEKISHRGPATKGQLPWYPEGVLITGSLILALLPVLHRRVATRLNPKP